MNSWKLLLSFWIVLIPALAQSEPAQITSKLIQIRYADVNHLTALLKGHRVNVFGDHPLKAIVLNGLPADIAAAEETIKALDVPPTAASVKNVEVTLYMMAASQQAAPENRRPPDVDAVVKQLRSVFPYQSYQVLETVLLRSRIGREASTSGLMKWLEPAKNPNQPPSTYTLRYLIGDVTEGKIRLIHIDGLRFGAKFPVSVNSSFPASQYSFMDAGMAAEIDVREGVKVVVGKSNIDTDTALFLIVTAKVVD